MNPASVLLRASGPRTNNLTPAPPTAATPISPAFRNPANMPFRHSAIPNAIPQPHLPFHPTVAKRYTHNPTDAFCNTPPTLLQNATLTRHHCCKTPHSPTPVAKRCTHPLTPHTVHTTLFTTNSASNTAFKVIFGVRTDGVVQCAMGFGGKGITDSQTGAEAPGSIQNSGFHPHRPSKLLQLDPSCTLHTLRQRPNSSRYFPIQRNSPLITHAATPYACTTLQPRTRIALRGVRQPDWFPSVPVRPCSYLFAPLHRSQHHSFSHLLRFPAHRSRHRHHLPEDPSAPISLFVALSHCSLKSRLSPR